MKYRIIYIFNDVSFTSIKFVFKIITVEEELKSYCTIKVINNIKKVGFVTSRGVVEGLCCQAGVIPV